MNQSKIMFGDLSRRDDGEDALFFSVLGKVLKSGKFILGDCLDEFERGFKDEIGVSDGFVLGVSNGSDAIRISLEVKKILANFREGEVALAANTYFAAAAAIVQSGLKPAFFDVCLETRFPDISTVSAIDVSNVIGVIKSHLYGGADTMNYQILFPSVWILEDASQAHGTKVSDGFVGGRNLTTYSFYPTKNLGAIGEAGAVVSFDDIEYELLKKLRNQGYSDDRTDHDLIGFNARLSELQAGFLAAKLIRFNERFRRRIEIYERYRDNLSNLSDYLHFFTYQKEVCSSHYLVQVYIRNELAVSVKERLQTKNIFCGSHYPKPLHMQKAFGFLGYSKGDFPNSEKLSNHALSLPNHPELTDSEIDYVSESLIQVLKQDCN